MARTKTTARVIAKSPAKGPKIIGVVRLPGSKALKAPKAPVKVPGSKRKARKLRIRTPATHPDNFDLSGLAASLPRIGEIDLTGLMAALPNAQMPL